MKRAVSAIFLAAALLAPLPANSAPLAFRAHGQVKSVADGEAQDMTMVLSFKGGRVRIETDSKDAGKSVMVARKGIDTVAMLDPSQKLIVRMKPSALRGRDNGCGQPSFEQLLDPTGFKVYLKKEGKRVGPGGAFLGHTTTLYQRSCKGDSMKIWFAEDLDLPLKMEGTSSKGDRFALKITSLDLKPNFGKSEFDDSPPGYQEIKAETNGQD